MARLLLSIVLTVFMVIFSSVYVAAQLPQGEWIFESTINPNVDPLEISGGVAFPGIDTFIVLDDNNLSNLMVYNIDRATRTVASTASIPVNTPAFGLGHVIRSANGTAHSCFTDNFELFAVQSQNGTDWNKVQVTHSLDYDSCDTAVSNGNVYIGACNTDGDAHVIFESQDNGQTWNQIQTINGVLCPTHGGTRPSFNMIDGVPVVFFMTGFGPSAAESSLNSETRFVEEGEQVLKIGEDAKIVDMDTPGGPLAESYPTKKVRGGVLVTPYYHRDSDTIRLHVKFGINGDETLLLGPAPIFDVFFGIACAEGPGGVVNVLTPDRHFQYNVETGELKQILRFPFINVNDGPVAASTSSNALGGILFGFFAIAHAGSFDYAIFGEKAPRPIPTLSQYGLIALCGVLMLIGVLYLRRRAKTSNT